MGGGKEKWRRKRRETFGEGTYVSVEEKKNREWKIFGEETYFFAEEKEEEGNNWRRKISWIMKSCCGWTGRKSKAV